MTTTDLSAFLEGDGLDITLGDHTYRVPAPDAHKGIRMTRLAQIGARVQAGLAVADAEREALTFEDEGETQDFIELVLTAPIRDQMIEDKLSYPVIQRTAQYVFAHFALSPETAMRALEAGAFSGEAMRPNRAQRRENAKPKKAKKSNATTSASRASSPRTKTRER